MPSTVSEPRTEVRTGPPPPRAVPRTRAERHERPLLLCIAALAALLFLWGLDHSAYHAFYASAVRSMTDSPAAFLYGSFDPAGSITLDKLPGFLWPQALSALVFGFHPWALVLPQAVEGVACVLLLHLVVRRWAGVAAGLAAAGFLTLTPVTVGVGRSVVEDAPFVLLLLLAAEATQRATARARPRTLLLAGFWVGAAFQCKMLEAWAVLPALAVTYLVAAPAPWRRRVGHLALAGAVTAAVSLSWMLVATLTPAGSRPYLDGTTDNSAFGMVVGYNFLTRFHALGIDAAGTGSIVTGRPAHPGGPPVSMGDSVWKMFSPGLATQTGWLYPLAALGLVGGLVALWRRRVPRTDRLLAGHVLWGVWLATFFVVFSFGSVTGHTYYMGVVAVALSALAGAGLVQGWRAVRAGGRAAWLLPAVIAVNVAWCAALTLCYPRFFGWSAPAAGVLCLAGLALTGVRRGRAVTAGTAVALAAVLLIPAVWSASALSPRYNQPGGFGRVGPNSIRTGDALSALTPARHRLLAYLTAHRDGARYLAAVPSWTVAAPYVIAADAPVLPVGGFTGRVRFPTPRGLSRLVDSGRLRFVLLRRSDLMDRPGAGRAQAGALARWTVVHCAPVPPAAYGGDGRRYLLYRCGPGSGA
ncbi:glycosyltransferase family 39 protein [Streptomyces shenzhenensis]|uniref:glycosyltransferase family 39 protein n=1 Tax=Streptomyces shenzhenensis TaxID=943815 RepID=UPI003817F037